MGHNNYFSLASPDIMCSKAVEPEKNDLERALQADGYNILWN